MQHPARASRIMELLPDGWEAADTLAFSDQVILDAGANWTDDRDIVTRLVMAWNARIPIYHFSWPGGDLLEMQLSVEVGATYNSAPINVET